MVKFQNPFLPLIANAKAFLAKPGNAFIPAGALLIISSATFYDGLIGVLVAGIGIYYLMN